MVAIVLLPGMDGTGTMFSELASHLAGPCRPIVVSYPANRPLDYGALENHVRHLVPKNEPFILLGESFSGPVAISLAASRPPGLIGLILCCTFARNPLPFLKRFKRIIDLLPLDSRLVAFATPLMFGAYATPALKLRLRHALDLVPASTLRARLRNVIDVDVSEKVRNIDVPVLYLQAASDRLVPRSAARHIHSLSGRVRIEPLRGPHLLLQAMPAEAGKVIRSYAEELTRAFNLPPS